MGITGKDRFLIFALAITSFCASAYSVPNNLPEQISLEDNSFRNPPDDARPMTWWHWMNGNITKEGITADLEAMQRVGVGGAQIFMVDGASPLGPVATMSPEWLGLVKHTVQEADRLGLKIGMHNCPGWSSSGGPWNKPEHGMKDLVSSETAVAGPSSFNAVLPEPQTTLGSYRDVAVLAYRAPKGTASDMKSFLKGITSSLAGSAPTNTVDKGPSLLLLKPAGTEPRFIQFEFSEPYRARKLTFLLGRGMEGGSGTVESSDDGKTFRKVRSFWLPRSGRIDARTECVFAPVTARFFRVVFNKLSPEGKKEVLIRDLDLSPAMGVNNLFGKAFYARTGYYETDTNLNPEPDELIAQKEVVDLTAQMKPDGTLNWKVPTGDWSILRIGFAPSGVANHPAPEGGEGLECDKLSAAAVDAHWNGMVGPVVKELGPLAGRVFSDVLIDSYEVGSQNWTEDFRQEFVRLRGYDPLPYLPVMAGHVVESPEITDRFLWDLRRTIADLFTARYAGRMKELAYQSGMRLWIEPYGNSPSDDIQYGGMADIPMSEFWIEKGIDGCTKLAASSAHVYGRNLVAAEAFTAGEGGGNKWNTDPYAQKALGDAAFCGGINLFVFHTYTHQPRMDITPGFTMGACGTHFGRTTTWWDQSRDWMRYLARSQWMLQQGLFVADACYFVGESLPVSMYGGNLKIADLPAGYDFDGCSAEALGRMTVKDGRLVLPDGMSYRMLLLPRQKAMTPAVLRKIKELADAGAVIVGPAPEQSPSLGNYPDCDREIQQLSKELWGSGKNGRISDKPLPEVFKAIGLKSDFEYAGTDAKLIYIHRKTADADIYFVSNQKQEAVSADCTFRVSGKAPELWNPETGATEPAAVYTEKDGRVTVPLRFDPSGSVFVVFRKPAVGDHVTAVSAPADWKLSVKDGGQLQLLASQNGLYEFKTASGKTLKAEVKGISAPVEVSGPWELSFPPKLGAPEKVTLDKLISWTEHPDSGVKYFSGTATYVKTVNIPAVAPGKALYLDLGDVQNIAEVKLNGKELGILWKPPFRVEITSAVNPGENRLEVRVTNLWPNRIIGDEQLPADCRWVGGRLSGWPEWFTAGKQSPSGRITFSTRRHWAKGDVLLPSGLLGPVKLQTAERIMLP